MIKSYDSSLGDKTYTYDFYLSPHAANLVLLQMVHANGVIMVYPRPILLGAELTYDEAHHMRDCLDSFYEELRRMLQLSGILCE